MKTMARLTDRSLSRPIWLTFFPGRHTVLDHYTFKWTEGRMALALGLGHCILLIREICVKYFRI